MSAPAAKQIVEQKRESVRAECQQKATYGHKPEVLPKMKAKHKAKNEVEPEKGGEKVVTFVITPAKVEQVGSSVGIRK